MIKNLFYFKHLGMGGTEQFLYEIAKKYSKDFDIVVAYESGNIAQIKRMAKYIGMIQYRKGMKIECERAFISYTIDIIDDLVCDDIIMVNHANYEVIIAKPPVHPRINRSIAVSQFTKNIFLKKYSTPTEVSYNPITMENYEKPLILMSAFRADDPVRGAQRCKILAEHLDEYCAVHDKRYLWMIFSNKPFVDFDSPNVVVIPPRVDVRAFMKMADWGVSLPLDMETYGYTNVEFLMNGVPLVTTPLTVCNELKMDDSMRLILNWDMSNADEIVEEMFTRKMNFTFSPPEDNWRSILKEGEKDTDHTVRICRVKANKNSFEKQIPLYELGRPARPGEVFETVETRLDNLVNGNNHYRMVFAEKI